MTFLGRRIVRFKVESAREAVAPAVERIVEVAGEVVTEPSQRANLAVAVSEALSNAVRHGHRDKPEARALVAMALLEGEGVVVDVRDSGPGFDVSLAGSCPCGARVLAPGGRGIFLMRELMDQVEFNARGNRVRLVLCCDERGKRFGSGDSRGLQSRSAQG